MPASWEGSHIRLELIKVNNLLSARLQAFTSTLMSIHGGAGNQPSESLREVPKLSMEIRVSYRFGRMLRNRDVVANFEMSWDELLDRGDEPFDISFPPIRDVRPSLMLKATVLHPCDDQDCTLLDVIEERMCTIGLVQPGASCEAWVYEKDIMMDKNSSKWFLIISFKECHLLNCSSIFWGEADRTSLKRVEEIAKVHTTVYTCKASLSCNKDDKFEPIRPKLLWVLLLTTRNSELKRGQALV
ncbi:hypothetical protein F4604DRAFT_1677641 [Suillus subluteus]|nr:hypothetical protein F4604DRAFT_1677641 [Suillus subluteus]